MQGGTGINRDFIKADKQPQEVLIIISGPRSPSSTKDQATESFNPEHSKEIDG